MFVLMGCGRGRRPGKNSPALGFILVHVSTSPTDGKSANKSKVTSERASNGGGDSGEYGGVVPLRASEMVVVVVVVVESRVVGREGTRRRRACLFSLT